MGVVPATALRQTLRQPLLFRPLLSSAAAKALSPPPTRRPLSSAAMPKFSAGAKGSATAKVSGENSAKTLGSGSLDVFATPAMVALMEKAACAALADSLAEGETTVGTGISVTHLSPTPLGLEVTAEAVVVEGGDKTCSFNVKAVDNSGALIGEGTHSRVLVGVEKFMAKANGKTAKE